MSQSSLPGRSRSSSLERITKQHKEASKLKEEVRETAEQALSLGINTGTLRESTRRMGERATELRNATVAKKAEYACKNKMVVWIFAIFVIMLIFIIIFN